MNKNLFTFKRVCIYIKWSSYNLPKFQTVLFFSHGHFLRKLKEIYFFTQNNHRCFFYLIVSRLWQWNFVFTCFWHFSFCKYGCLLFVCKYFKRKLLSVCFKLCSCALCVKMIKRWLNVVRQWRHMVPRLYKQEFFL
jgi:hypothetical protein